MSCVELEIKTCTKDKKFNETFSWRTRAKQTEWDNSYEEIIDSQHIFKNGEGFINSFEWYDIEKFSSASFSS